MCVSVCEGEGWLISICMCLCIGWESGIATTQGEVIGQPSDIILVWDKVSVTRRLSGASPVIVYFCRHSGIANPCVSMSASMVGFFIWLWSPVQQAFHNTKPSPQPKFNILEIKFKINTRIYGSYPKKKIRSKIHLDHTLNKVSSNPSIHIT